MIKFFVNRPVTTIMFVLFWVLLGAWSLPKMNIERTPPIDLPMVSVSLVYPGASPLEVEEQVLKPVEDAVSEVSQIKRLTAQAFEHGGFVLVEFDLESDVNHKSLEVKDKVEAILQDLPTELDKPKIEKLNVLQESVVDIVLYDASGEIDDFLRRAYFYSIDNLANKFTAISGVASVKVTGGEERAIRVDLNPVQMTARGVAITDITDALAKNNLNFPGGKIEQGANSMQVRFVGELANVEDVANVAITTAEGLIFRLKDVASVTDSFKKPEAGARFDGRDIVMLSIVKSSDGNAINISEKILADLQRHTDATRAELGEGATLEVVSNQATYVLKETNSTLNGIILGMILTIVILLIFTRNWRTTIIACVVIPTSLIAALFFMQLAGFSINSLTMLAMATALGTLIFNAIIIIESALQLMRQGATPEDAAINGTKRVFAAVLAGAGTNICVFLPIALMGGIAGLFMRQFGLSVVFITLFSLMFSFTLTPMMIALMLRVKKEKGKREVAKKAEKTFMKKVFDFQFRRPLIVIAAAFGILFASSMLMKFVGNEFAPETDIAEITIYAQAPRGATFQKSVEIAKEIEARISDFPEVIGSSVDIGTNGVENVVVIARLKPFDQRDITDKQLAQLFVPKLSTIIDAEISVRAGKAMAGNVADIVMNITGDDNELREGYAHRAIEIINKIPEIQSARLSAQNPGYEYRFIPNQDKMNLWGVTNVQAATALRLALYGTDDAYKFRDNGQEVPIIIAIGDEFMHPDMFGDIVVKSAKGLVPLDEIGEIRREPASPNIYRRDKGRVSELQIILGKSTLGPVQAEITRALNSQIDWQPGYGFYFAGIGEMQAESNTEMGGAFILAILLTYMLLAAIMNSMLHPFTIATGILTSFAGVFIMLFLAGASINIAAMLSIIMLVGLAVNNNIIILEPATNLVRGGMDMKTAVWSTLQDRSRMILMTSIAVVSGMVPQLWAPEGMKSSMGAVIVGGMLAALVFVYFLTPALFFAFERLRSRFVRVKKS